MSSVALQLGFDSVGLFFGEFVEDLCYANHPETEKTTLRNDTVRNVQLPLESFQFSRKFIRG